MKYLTKIKLALCLGLLLFVMSSLDASSHREAPLIANDPLADNVDVYAFRSSCHMEHQIIIVLVKM